MIWGWKTIPNNPERPLDGDISGDDDDPQGIEMPVNIENGNRLIGWLHLFVQAQMCYLTQQREETVDDLLDEVRRCSQKSFHKRDDGKYI